MGADPGRAVVGGTDEKQTDEYTSLRTRREPAVTLLVGPKLLENRTASTNCREPKTENRSFPCAGAQQACAQGLVEGGRVWEWLLSYLLTMDPPSIDSVELRSNIQHPTSPIVIKIKIKTRCESSRFL